MKFVYKQNYTAKFLLLGVLACTFCVLSRSFDFRIINIPSEDVVNYHTSILTINSIFCGFSLTNLGILLSINNEELVKKLNGTDILQKRNIVIGHSIIFGATSIFISMLWIIRVDVKLFMDGQISKMLEILKEFLFYVEIFSLIISILYFMLSIKKMIEILALIYAPRKKYSDKQTEDMKDKIFRRKQM